MGVWIAFVIDATAAIYGALATNLDSTPTFLMALSITVAVPLIHFVSVRLEAGRAARAHTRSKRNSKGS